MREEIIISRRTSYKWKTYDGRLIDVREMEFEHIVNSIRLLYNIMLKPSYTESQAELMAKIHNLNNELTRRFIQSHNRVNENYLTEYKEAMSKEVL